MVYCNIRKQAWGCKIYFDQLTLVFKWCVVTCAPCNRITNGAWTKLCSGARTGLRTVIIRPRHHAPIFSVLGFLAGLYTVQRPVRAQGARGACTSAWTQPQVPHCRFFCWNTYAVHRNSHTQKLKSIEP